MSLVEWLAKIPPETPTEARIIFHAQRLEPGVPPDELEKYRNFVAEMRHLTRIEQLREFELIYALAHQVCAALVVAVKAVKCGIEEK